MKAIRILSAVAVLGMGLQLSTAGDECCKPKDKCCSSRVLVCKPTVKTEKVKKSCFEIKCKHICIPRVTLPWERSKNSGADCCADNCAANGAVCCEPGKCGKIKLVRTLSKKSYECGEKCVYEYKIEDITDKGLCCPNGSCGKCAAPCDACAAPAGQHVEPAPAPSKGKTARLTRFIKRIF